MKKLVLGALAVLAFGFRVQAQDRFVSEEPQNRKAILEEYTAIHCGYCPAGHRIANQMLAKYPGEFFVINIHTGNLAKPNAGEVDLRTSYGDNLASRSGLSGYPAGSVNRHVFSGKVTAMDRGSWANAVSQALQMPSYVNVAAKGTLDWETRELTVTVQMYYTDNSPSAVNFVNVAVLQNNILGTQASGNTNPDQLTPDGKYIHGHVFRDFLTGQWGDSVITTQTGSFVQKTYTKTLPEVVGNVGLMLADLDVIAFVAESKDEIMNVCEVELEHLNGPTYLAELSGLQQADHYTCDDEIRMAFTYNNRIAKEPIASLSFSCETGAGTTEFTYTPETPITKVGRYEIVTDPLPLANLGKEEKVKVTLTKINGQEYEGNVQTLESSAIKYYGYSTTPVIDVNIWQDRYGKDITWTLKTVEGETVAEGGPYTDLSSNGVRQRTSRATLASSGCHVFTIYDAHSDGINNGSGEGHLNIADTFGHAVLEHNGKYGDSLYMMLRYSAVANEYVPEQINAMLAPNPASEYSVLSFELPSARTIRVRVWNSRGMCVTDLGSRTLSAGSQEIRIPVASLSEGLYFVTLQGENFNLTRKLVVTK